jgi:O-methyltransferase involved in polyketide biosynthesis
MSDSARISPTAHYTGYVWARNGLSHPELETVEGRVLYESLRGPMIASNVLRNGTLEQYLLARHRAIDALLERAIEDGRVAQVLEVACGLSGRGLRFSEKYGDRLTYVEADLPGMVARKQAALERIGSLSDRHRVEQVDVLRAGGPGSLAALAATLDPEQGLAIITEGLLSYLDGAAVQTSWRHSAQTLGGFSHGTYLADIRARSDENQASRVFRGMLSAFVRGQVHIHYETYADVVTALKEAGFASASVEVAADILAGTDAGKGALYPSHILEAST